MRSKNAYWSWGGIAAYLKWFGKGVTGCKSRRWCGDSKRFGKESQSRETGGGVGMREVRGVTLRGVTGNSHVNDLVRLSLSHFSLVTAEMPHKLEGSSVFFSSAGGGSYKQKHHKPNCRGSDFLQKQC